MSNDLSLVEAVRYFSDEALAEQWFIKRRWKHGIRCAHCNGRQISKCGSDRPQPFRCRTCWKYFSVRTKTLMHSSKLPYSKWAITLYLMLTHPKGISSIQLSKAIGVQQRTAWFMLHKIRNIAQSEERRFWGPIEVDEAYIGGLEKNKHSQNKLRIGRGGVGKAPVVGMWDRTTGRVLALASPTVHSGVLHEFIHQHTWIDTKVSTDDNRSYQGIHRIHGTVRHSRGEYVKGWISTNGIESFWALFKRGFKGTYHWMSVKYLQKYLNEFMVRNRMRRYSIDRRMTLLFRESVGCSITYSQIVDS